MVKPNIISEEPMTLSEVKSDLDKIKKEAKELNFRSNKTHEFLTSIKLTSLKDTKEIIKKLDALEIPRLKESHIKKLIDIMPTTEQEVDIVFQGLPVTINKDNKKKILDALKKFTN